MKPLKFFRKMIMATSLAFIIFVSGGEAEAVDYYSAIYQTVNRYNGNEVECELFSTRRVNIKSIRF